MTVKKKTAKNATKARQAHPLSAHDPGNTRTSCAAATGISARTAASGGRSGLGRGVNWNRRPGAARSLHGWLWGEGRVCVGSTHGTRKSSGSRPRHEIPRSSRTGGKNKIPAGMGQFVGTPARATVDPDIAARGIRARDHLQHGDGGRLGTATAGYAGTATAGIRGTATAGLRWARRRGIRGSDGGLHRQRRRATQVS